MMLQVMAVLRESEKRVFVSYAPLIHRSRCALLRVVLPVVFSIVDCMGFCGPPRLWSSHSHDWYAGEW